MQGALQGVGIDVSLDEIVGGAYAKGSDRHLIVPEAGQYDGGWLFSASG